MVDLLPQQRLLLQARVPALAVTPVAALVAALVVAPVVALAEALVVAVDQTLLTALFLASKRTPSNHAEIAKNLINAKAVNSVAPS